MSELPKAIWEGSFRLFGVDVQCAVLDTGERIIEASSMDRMFAAMAHGAACDQAQIDAFTRWRSGVTVH